MADLNKNIFGLKVENHELLGRAYRAYLANGRSAGAVTKQRGDVRGGGRKPWQQKGTGRARIGSIRAPHWRGGGVTFGPTGDQNYQISIPTTAKRVAIRQALSVQNQDKLVVTFPGLKLKDAKTKTAVEFLNTQKVADKKRVLIVVGAKEPEQMRAFANLQNVKLISAKYLNVYDILNADAILISTDSLKILDEWLDTPAKSASAPKTSTETSAKSAKVPKKAPAKAKEAKK